MQISIIDRDNNEQSTEDVFLGEHVSYDSGFRAVLEHRRK